MCRESQPPAGQRAAGPRPPGLAETGHSSVLSPVDCELGCERTTSYLKQGQPRIQEQWPTRVSRTSAKFTLSVIKG